MAFSQKFYLAFLSFKLFSFKAIFALHLKSSVGICNITWDNDDEVLVFSAKNWLLGSSLWRVVGFEIILLFALPSKKIDVADWLFLAFPYVDIL